MKPRLRGASVGLSPRSGAFHLFGDGDGVVLADGLLQVSGFTVDHELQAVCGRDAGCLQRRTDRGMRCIHFVR